MNSNNMPHVELVALIIAIASLFAIVFLYLGRQASKEGSCGDNIRLSFPKMLMCMMYISHVVTYAMILFFSYLHLTSSPIFQYMEGLGIAAILGFISLHQSVVVYIFMRWGIIFGTDSITSIPSIGGRKVFPYDIVTATIMYPDTEQESIMITGGNETIITILKHKPKHRPPAKHIYGENYELIKERLDQLGVL